MDEESSNARFRRRTIMAMGPQLALIVGVCLWRGEGPAPRLDVLAIIVGLAVLGELKSFTFGNIHITVTAPAWALGVTLLGLVPGVLICGIVPAVDLIRRRAPWWPFISNCLCSAQYAVAAGLVFGFARDAGWTAPQTDGLPVWVFLAAIAGGVTGYGSVVIFMLHQKTFKAAVGDIVPTIPIEVCGAAVAAATALAYSTIGIEALGGLVLFTVMLIVVLETVSRTERRRDALVAELASVEQRERERLAAGLTTTRSSA